MTEQGRDADHRAGFVALLGPPNAGKSTLLNRLLGERLAIVTAKPQTTRSRILGILTRPEAQLMLVDTPGLHESSKRLNAALNAAVAEAVGDCDVAVLLVDRTLGWQEGHQQLLAQIESLAKPLVIVGTKGDLGPVAGEGWLPGAIRETHECVELSAMTGEGVLSMLASVVAHLPVSPPLYPEEDLTDRPLRWLCAEFVREAAFEYLQRELPYSIAVEVIQFDESREDFAEIHANILVERSSQKRIVVGAGGEMVKRIGTRARKSIEKFVGHRVHLQLFIKVDPKWLKSSERIESLGYF